MSLEEDAPNKEFVNQELQTITHYVEHHVHWAKSDGNQEFARLHMVTAECLIESARLIRTLSEKLNTE